MAMEMTPIATTPTRACTWRRVLGSYDLPSHAPENISHDTLRRLYDRVTAVITGRKALVLKVGLQRLTFRSLPDFEFALESRTDYPVSHLKDLMKLSAVELERASLGIRNVEHRLLDLVTRSLERPGGLTNDLRKLEVNVFSTDHAWKEIFQGLMTRGRAYDEFKKVALAKYLQYLGARQHVLKSLHGESIRRQGKSASNVMAQILSETAIFDTCSEDSRLHPSARFEALPRGETVGIRLGEHCELELRLSQHRFQLIGGKRFLLRDETGRQFPLHPGKNFVGRQRNNDVVVDAGFRAISRRHLIVEPVGEHAAVLTDLSSHGTFVPPQCVA